MRINYEPQMTFGMIPIDKIEFDIFSRHEIIPVLMSLQHLYVHEKNTVNPTSWSARLNPIISAC